MEIPQVIVSKLVLDKLDHLETVLYEKETMDLKKALLTM